MKTGDNLYFYNQVVKPESSEKKVVEISAHHTFIIDCSGSMYGELSQIRKDLYNKISTMLKPNDSVTIIWFSGRGQYGVLLEDYHVKSAVQLNKVKDQINKYLTPQGLTAFKEPILELKEVIKRVRERNTDMLHTMFFLTDGYDNQWSTKEILSAIESVKEELSSATIVEYGWYCNKQLLNQMATAVGGVHTFSENFDEYEPYVEKVFNNGQSVKRRYIKLDHIAHNGVVFNIVDGDIITYLPNEDNEIFVSVDGEVELFYFTEELPSATNLGSEEFISDAVLNGDTSSSIISGLYGAAFAYSRKSDYNMVSEILKFLGDAYLIIEKSNTFGTQKINELEAKFVNCMNDNSARYTQGYNPDLEPAEDAFCVLDMLELLMSDDENAWYPRHEAFSYKRTGGKAVAKNKSEITEEQKESLKDLLEGGDLSGLESKLKEVKENVVEALTFNYSEENPSSPFYNLTWNETRANLSVMVNYKGYVNLPANKFNIPEKFETEIFRNYTIIKDGVIHTYTLPVSLSKSTFDTLQMNGLLEGETYEAGKIYVLTFDKIPVINRKMVETLSAKDLFEKSFELLRLQSANTVFTQYKKRLFDGASKGFLDLYGAEATEWLKELGLKDYGFNPPSVIEKMNEEIQVNTLEIKIKGLASNPTKADFEKAETKLKAGIDINSLSGKEALVAPSILEFMTFEKTLSGLSDESKSKMISEWLYSKSESFRKTKTKLMTDISKAKFLIIVGKSWFQEFSSRDDNEMSIIVDGNDLSCSVIDKMATIKL
jgi:uncharacterized protein YegL